MRAVFLKALLLGSLLLPLALSAAISPTNPVIHEKVL